MSKRLNRAGCAPLRIFLWSLTVLWLAFCLYLSWQTGPETAGLSERLAQVLLKVLGVVGLTPDPQRFHMDLRLFAHFGVFFITGVLFAASLEVSLPGGSRKDITVFLLGSSICAFIAVAAEVGKLSVPGRHLTWSEAGLNVLGAVCGTAAVCLAAHLYASWKAKRKQPQK